MSVCQRCGEELSKTVYTMLGHSYKDGSDSKAATCTEAGMKHQTCERCDHVIREEIPAIGHKMVEDQTRRVEATCATAGQTVEVCENAGCDHEQVKETAQKAHSFENSELETVYPDCTNGGYDHQKCDLCGEDIISNQKSPLGHNYAVATENGWKWNEDMTEVEINLVCRNNDTHTKTIKATITKKAEAATCTGNGSVTYTATATFNGNTFTKTVTVPVAALSHQASGDWQTNAKQHYRICGVCGEKADASDHTWGEKVVNKQATCVEAGSATYTCNICGYVKNETLPATGQHNLVDGKCTSCDFAENTCDHVKTHKVPVDLSAYDICGDMYLTIEQCECGAMSSYEMGYMSCEWKEPDSYMVTTEDGLPCEVSVMTCAKCGLTIEESWYSKANEDSCTGYRVTAAKFSIGDQVIAETYIEYQQYPIMHPITVCGESVDLKQFGLCGGTMTKMSCKCGEAYWYDIQRDCGPFFHCENCNGFINQEDSENITGDNCVYFYIPTYKIWVNDEVVHTFQEKYATTQHDYVVDSYEMAGTSCEDGVRITYKCTKCGATSAQYIEDHAPVMETIIDLTGYGSCAPAVTQSSCICGQEKAAYEGTFGKPVEHDWVSSLEEDLEVIATCSKCNYTMHAVAKLGDKDEECNAFMEATYTLTDGKGHTYSYEEAYFIEHHDMKQEMVLLGSKCTDGVEAKVYCVDCGYIQYQEFMNDHIGQIKERYDLSEYGMCGEPTLFLFECLCGEQSGHDIMYNDYSNTCNWNWMSGDEYSSKRQCTKCGVIWESETEVLEKIDDCHQRTKVVQTFSKDNEKLVELSYDSVYDTHKNICSFDLKNPSEGCNGGYDVHLTCSVCGETNTWYDRWDHDGFPIDRELVSVNQLCGDLEIVTYSCACGMDVWTNTEWSNGRCNFQWDGNARVCTECGAVYTQKEFQKPVEGEPCKVAQVRNIKIDKNGKNICDYSSEMVVTSHNEVVQYNLLGETCDDGYTYTYSCATCGELLREVTDTQYGCNMHAVEVFDVAQSDEICGPVKIRIAKCACGKKQQVWQDWYCNFNWYWDEKNDREVAQCSDCGLIMYENTDFERIPGTCTQNRTYDYRFELNDVVIGTFQGTYVVESHNTVATYQMFGATCEDGFYVTQTCVRCDYSETWEEWSHCNYQTGYYDLSEYGMCGGEYFISNCPCGKYSGYGWDGKAECNWEHKNHDNATGTDTYYCSKCQTFRYVTQTGQRNPATCTYTGTETITFERNDEVLLSFTVDNNYESHAMVVDSATLLNPDGNCEDGVTVMQHCEDCGFTQTRTYYRHEDLTTIRVDLSDGCGGELRFGACVCGENKFFHQGYQCQNMVHTRQDWTDSDGIYHNNYVDVCPDCGLTIEDDWYNIWTEGSCEVTSYETYTVTYGSETYVYERTNSWTSHRDTVTIGGSLKDGATSCEDGVRVQVYCNLCGITFEAESEDHHVIRRESIDLADYGSYCGATLDLYSCACGAQQRYDIGHDSQCDVGRQGINHWIPDVIDEIQDTSEGYIGTYSYAHLLKCAVSNPVACGLTIRMAEYWLNENCMAVEYQTWQLGYDEQTGTWEREITIPTGEKHAYHPYVTTNIDENPDANTHISGTRWTCPDCGSYAIQQNTFVNDIETKFECRYVNTQYATNGEKQERGDATEYGYVANGHNYATRNYNYWIHNDGYLEWNLHEYSNYDFSNNDCRRTNTWTNDRNDNSVSEESAHLVSDCEYYYDPKPTCSQHGTEHHVHMCVVCGREDTHDKWDVSPTAHYWYWDSDKDCYVCSECGLESAVGATGSICMEDLTEDGESVYKIGYWNRNNINFVPKVSVILKDATTDDNELVLSGIEFNYLTVKDDGVRALTFGKDAAQQAAEAAMANVSYTGDYAIRISFVPIDDIYTLDYAITFDSLNAAQ